jgi:hypothetical protein
MRCILGLCVILATFTPVAFAFQDPTVSTSVPNIQASGAPTVTVPSVPNASQVPTGAPVATAPMTTYTTPMGNTVYTYPARPFGRVFGRGTPQYYSTTNATTTTAPAPTYYYMPVRRRWPFNIFGPRYVATTAYAAPGSYYTTPVYRARQFGPMTLYTPTMYTVPAGTTAPAASTPVYTPTSYNVPTQTAPAAGATGATPATTAPAPTTRSIPSSPPLPRVRTPFNQ